MLSVGFHRIIALVEFVLWFVIQAVLLPFTAFIGFSALLISFPLQSAAIITAGGFILTSMDFAAGTDLNPLWAFGAGVKIIPVLGMLFIIGLLLIFLCGLISALIGIFWSPIQSHVCDPLFDRLHYHLNSGTLKSLTRKQAQNMIFEFMMSDAYCPDNNTNDKTGSNQDRIGNKTYVNRKIEI